MSGKDGNTYNNVTTLKKKTTILNVSYLIKQQNGILVDILYNHARKKSGI